MISHSQLISLSKHQLKSAVFLYIIAGINPEGASTTNTTVDTSPESAPCKQLGYQDYANYFIVMSGDLLGNCFVVFVVVL